MDLVITGGNGNLGKTVVDLLISNGHNLHLTVRELHAANEPGKSFYMADLTNSKAVASFANELLQNTTPGAVVFLAGGFMQGNILETTAADISKMILLNGATAVNIVHSFLPSFIKNGKGKFIFIGAKAAMDMEQNHLTVAYSLSKRMLFDYCGMINAACKTKNISAHILLPATLDTQLNREQMPHADFALWTKPQTIAECISAIIAGQEEHTAIEL